MSRFKELQLEERPREKAYRYGLSTLSDAELIALIIQKGSKKHDVLSLSRILLQHFGGLPL